MQMGNQVTNNNIKHKKRYCKCKIHKQRRRRITARVIDGQVSNKGSLVSHCHGDFTIAKSEIFSKERKDKKENGENE